MKNSKEYENTYLEFLLKTAVVQAKLLSHIKG